MPVDCKKKDKKDRARGMGASSSVFYPTKRQDAEGGGGSKASLNLNALSWLLPFNGDTSQVYR